MGLKLYIVFFNAAFRLCMIPFWLEDNEKHRAYFSVQQHNKGVQCKILAFAVLWCQMFGLKRVRGER